MRLINREDQVSMLLVEQNATLALGHRPHRLPARDRRGRHLRADREKIKNDENVKRSYLATEV